MLNFLFSHSPLFYLLQSFWRDEAFSVLFVQLPFSSIFTKSLMEPPVYYTLLYFWVRVFGQGEIAVRSLSLLGFILLMVVWILWSEKLFPRHFLSWGAPLLMLVNPMLLYYACEVRAYSWYAFFAILSFYAYDTKRWKLYRIAIILGLYTHLYFIFIPFAQGLHFFITEKKSLVGKSFQTFKKNPMIISLVLFGIAFLPWAVKYLHSLSVHKESWYYPVDLRQILAALGNIYLGYEGTPWYLWFGTILFSFILFRAFLFAREKAENKRTAHHMFILITIPLAVILGISLVKPFFVNRYFIFIAIAQTVLLSQAIRAVPKVSVQKIFFLSIVACLLFFNIWYPDKHPKNDIRKTMTEVNMLASADDFIYVVNPINFLETLYYAEDRNQVKWYNPSGALFPWYVGGAVFKSSYNTKDIPVYPAKAFMIEKDGTWAVTSKLPNTKKVL